MIYTLIFTYHIKYASIVYAVAQQKNTGYFAVAYMWHIFSLASSFNKLLLLLCCTAVNVAC